MDPRTHFALLVRYHVWATERLYRHVDELPEAEYRSDCGLFFESVHGTLNHLLVAEQVWFARFAEGVSPRLALNTELESDRDALRRRFTQACGRWGRLIDAMPPGRFDARIEYVSTEGAARSLPFSGTLTHVFNHGTHHRGQITAAITSMGHACPEIDLVWMLAEESP